LKHAEKAVLPALAFASPRCTGTLLFLQHLPKQAFVFSSGLFILLQLLLLLGVVALADAVHGDNASLVTICIQHSDALLLERMSSRGFFQAVL